MRELGGTVAGALADRRTRRGGGELRREHVNACGGEIGQAAHVVEVEVRRDDVANVLALPAEPLDVGEGRLLAQEARLGEDGEAPAEASARIVDIRVPSPVSTSTRPCDVSTRRQWQTIVAASNQPPRPFTSRALMGHSVPQSR